ncbi:MAG: hypothetical protein ACREXS_20570 [Gammaproteobacteria bacterium]
MGISQGQVRFAKGPRVDRDAAWAWDISQRSSLCGGFLVMMFASLTPYGTVGAFMMNMMVLAGVLTIACLPSLITGFSGWLLSSVQPTPSLQREGGQPSEGLEPFSSPRQRRRGLSGVLARR